MNQPIAPLRVAPAALLAAAAIPFTPALAQTAPTDAAAPGAAVPVLPDPVAAPPEVTPAPAAPAPVMQSSPVVQPVPTATAPAVTPASEATTAQPPAKRASATAAKAPVKASAKASPPAPAPVPPVASPAPASSPAPIIAPQQPAAAAAPDRTRDLALGGLAGIVVLGGLATLAWRRRRGDSDAEAGFEAPVYTPSAKPQVPAEPKPFVFADPAPAVLAPRVSYAAMPSAPLRAEPAGDGETAGELMRMQVPGTPEGRRALIERIALAEPDEANPFRSPKARLRRARLIVQGMARRQEQADDGAAPGIASPARVSEPVPELTDA
jgi:hypothetical protein